MCPGRPEAHSEEIVALAIERIGARGDGVAQYRGEPVFVPFTVPGDRVRARLGARRHGGWEGYVADRLACGPERAAPPCRHFGTCGGCALQHLDGASYRRFKLERLDTALERVGICPDIVGPMRLVPPERRRARLGISRPRDPRLPARVGYRERFRHELVDLVNVRGSRARAVCNVSSLTRRYDASPWCCSAQPPQVPK